MQKIKLALIYFSHQLRLLQTKSNHWNHTHVSND